MEDDRSMSGECGPEGSARGEPAPDEPTPGSRAISRRDLLRSAGLASAAAVFPAFRGVAEGEGEILPDETAVALNTAPPTAPSATPVAPRRDIQMNLTVEETEILDAMVARLIPADDLGPGAREAGAVQFIDRELGGALADTREAYRIGLSALDRYAEYSRGARFVELSEDHQDSVLFDVQIGAATGSGAGFAGSSAAFFNLVKGHVWQATFGDPFYGGNQDYIGWRLIRYPGARMAVTAEDQRLLEAGELPLLERSAYD